MMAASSGVAGVHVGLKVRIRQQRLGASATSSLTLRGGGLVGAGSGKVFWGASSNGSCLTIRGWKGAAILENARKVIEGHEYQ